MWRPSVVDALRREVPPSPPARLADVDGTFLATKFYGLNKRYNDRVSARSKAVRCAATSSLVA